MAYCFGPSSPSGSESTSYDSDEIADDDMYIDNGLDFCKSSQLGRFLATDSFSNA